MPKLSLIERPKKPVKGLAMPLSRLVTQLTILISCVIDLSACTSDPLLIEHPVLDALEPEIERLAVCALDLHDSFVSGLVASENVTCVVAVARNMVGITEAAND
ncbi:hypothetical protein JI664_03445 [Rhodobacter sp. NTK016B]|uniref:hypothetical protein n=1 Tax=Rhodobacter sp. NTK016B TaxID=2759676 RepID=UPI001A8E5472|nr:hypothetical protein [Rhodobacter sp. NTK016B]MBN8291011.1 hypothetical protein [Rhodobacter sp. NTK016B]